MSANEAVTKVVSFDRLFHHYSTITIDPNETFAVLVAVRQVSELSGRLAL